MNKKIIVLIVILAVIVGIVYLTNKKAIAPVVVAPDTNVGVPATGQAEVCYFKETTGEFEGTKITDDAFTSINYDADGKVHGLINWIPGEKDSLVGAYTGVVEKSDIAGYPTRLNIIYSGWGEGILSKQQEILIVGANDIQTGTGDMYQDTDGVWKIKDINNLTYGNALPVVDCASVPDRIKADYSKAS